MCYLFLSACRVPLDSLHTRRTVITHKPLEWGTTSCTKSFEQPWESGRVEMEMSVCFFQRSVVALEWSCSVHCCVIARAGTGWVSRPHHAKCLLRPFVLEDTLTEQLVFVVRDSARTPVLQNVNTRRFSPRRLFVLSLTFVLPFSPRFRVSSDRWTTASSTASPAQWRPCRRERRRSSRSSRSGE